MLEDFLLWYVVLPGEHHRDVEEGGREMGMWPPGQYIESTLAKVRDSLGFGNKGGALKDYIKKTEGKGD